MHDAGGARPARWRPAWSSSATTSAPRWCCSRSCSACSGWSARPPRFFVVVHLARQRGRRSSWPRPAPSGWPRITNFADPFKDFHDTGWQPAHGLYALSTGGWFGQGIGASQQKWGDLPEAHTDFIFAVLGEELGLVGTLLVIGAVPHHRLRRAAGRPRDRGPVRPLRDLRHRGLAARPDDHQRRHGARAAAGHRHPAAAGLLRRLRAACPRWSRSACWSASPAASPRPPRALAAAPPAPRPPGCPPARRALERPPRLIPMRVLLAGGGTAGHTSPLLATADALRRLDPTSRSPASAPRAASRPAWSPRPATRSS